MNISTSYQAMYTTRTPTIANVVSNDFIVVIYNPCLELLPFAQIKPQLCKQNAEFLDRNIKE